MTDTLPPDHPHDPTTRVHAECPGCGAKLAISFRNAAKPVALAVYDGVPGGRSDDDAELLRRVAAWLDRIDDATDAEMAAAGRDHAVRDGAGPTIQDDLRRIASRFEHTEQA